MAGSEGGGRGGSSVDASEGAPGSAAWGEKKEKPRALLLCAPGCQARPPPPSAEPAAARGLLELGGSRARALYSRPRAGGGDGLAPLGSPGNRLPACPRTSGAFPASHWPPPIFFLLGAGRSLGAGPPPARGGPGARPGWVLRVLLLLLLLGGGGNVASLLGGRTVEKPQHVSRGWRRLAVLDVSFPARSCQAEWRLILTPTQGFNTERAGIAKCKNTATVGAARLVCEGCCAVAGGPGLGGGRACWGAGSGPKPGGWRLRPGCTWRPGGGGAAAATRAAVSPPGGARAACPAPHPAQAAVNRAGLDARAGQSV